GLIPEGRHRHIPVAHGRTHAYPSLSGLSRIVGQRKAAPNRRSAAPVAERLGMHSAAMWRGEGRRERRNRGECRAMIPIEQAGAWIREARHVAALTGAGVSAESGIPTFRGLGGLWRGRDPMSLATPEAFARDPAVVWEFYNWRRDLVARAEPNPA